MPLTKKESQILKDFIHKQIVVVWVSCNYQRQYIDISGVNRIENKIDDLTGKVGINYAKEKE